MNLPPINGDATHNILFAVAGVLIIVGILWEAFETVVLPRRVARRFRFTVLVYRGLWHPWKLRRRPDERHQASRNISELLWAAFPADSVCRLGRGDHLRIRAAVL